MTDEACDLDVMHGEHHGARAAGAGERGAHGCELTHAATQSAQRSRYRGGQGPRLFQRVDSLGREARLPVDLIGVLGGNIDYLGSNCVNEFQSAPLKRPRLFEGLPQWRRR